MAFGVLKLIAAVPRDHRGWLTNNAAAPFARFCMYDDETESLRLRGKQKWLTQTILEGREK